MRLREIPVDIDTLEVTQKLEKDKILVMVLDGKTGKAKITEIAEHGQTVIETVKGRVFRVSYKEDELF